MKPNLDDTVSALVRAARELGMGGLACSEFVHKAHRILVPVFDLVKKEKADA